jgi:hypothetical protein
LRPGRRRAFPSIGCVHVRRALLLFAIVLGLAAIAASLSREPDEGAEAPPPPAASDPTVSPGTATPPRERVELVFEAERDQTRRLDAGSAASLLVEVGEAGLVEIPELGLSGPADELTPARFEVLPRDPERLEISFTPVDDDATSPAGTLVVRAGAEQ